MIKVLIADDHAMFADGVESILAVEPDIKLMGKCPDGEAIFKTLQHSQPDVILLDINLPKINGIEACKRLRAEYPDIKILVISMFNEEGYATEMLQIGAHGYILKNAGREELLKALRAIYGGRSYFSKEVTDTIMRSITSTSGSPAVSARTVPKLSVREKEVLQLICEELTTQEIAQRLFISLKTVESHRSSLLAKLNVRNTAGLVKMAIEHKLLDN